MVKIVGSVQNNCKVVWNDLKLTDCSITREGPPEGAITANEANKFSARFDEHNFSTEHANIFLSLSQRNLKNICHPNTISVDQVYFSKGNLEQLWQLTLLNI